MNPSEVQWTKEGEGVSTTLHITCKPDGSYHFRSGTFQADSEDESEAKRAIGQLLQNGSTKAQQS